MRARHALSLVAALALVGCDRITGAADQKILDAQAVGYACRISVKTPEDCMKENETHSPTYVLNGWKEADRDINERVIDPSMGKRAAAAPAARTTPAAKAAGKAETELPASKVPEAKVVASEKIPAKPGKTEPGKKPAP